MNLLPSPRLIRKTSSPRDTLRDPGTPRSVSWAYLHYVGAGRSQVGRRMIDEALARNPEARFALRARALELVKEGRRVAALAMLPMLPRQRAASPYHHRHICAGVRIRARR
jgi:hypothetical protein